MRDLRALLEAYMESICATPAPGFTYAEVARRRRALTDAVFRPSGGTPASSSPAPETAGPLCLCSADPSLAGQFSCRCCGAKKGEPCRHAAPAPRPPAPDEDDEIPKPSGDPRDLAGVSTVMRGAPAPRPEETRPEDEHPMIDDEARPKGRDLLDAFLGPDNIRRDGAPRPEKTWEDDR